MPTRMGRHPPPVDYIDLIEPRGVVRSEMKMDVLVGQRSCLGLWVFRLSHGARPGGFFPAAGTSPARWHAG